MQYYNDEWHGSGTKATSRGQIELNISWKSPRPLRNDSVTLGRASTNFFPRYDIDYGREAD